MGGKCKLKSVINVYILNVVLFLDLVACRHWPGGAQHGEDPQRRAHGPQAAAAQLHPVRAGAAASIPSGKAWNTKPSLI